MQEGTNRTIPRTGGTPGGKAVAAATTRERRDVGRTLIRRAASVRLCNGKSLDDPLQVRIRDVSPGGIALLVERALPAGLRFYILAADVNPDGAHGGRIWLLYRTVRCTRAGSTLFHVGAQFVTAVVAQARPPVTDGEPKDAERLGRAMFREAAQPPTAAVA